MVAIASRARTAVAIAVAGAAIAGGLLLKQRKPTCAVDPEVRSDILRAALTSTTIQPGDQDIAVTITMPRAGEVRRPNIALAVVLDRSGSMHGEPLENAKAAASALVTSLADDDAFSIVTFSDRDELVVKMGKATKDHKAEALAAIDRIVDEGGTCTSCGISRGTTELESSTLATTGVKRMVLISDGQANEGIWDRDELVQLAESTAANGISMSTVGVGLDFDEQTMIRLGENGHGNYYFVKDTANLAKMFQTELTNISTTVATDVQLMVTETAGTQIEYAYGYPMTRTDRGRVMIPVADLRAGETRKVVLHAHVIDSHVAKFGLLWKDPADNQRHETYTTLSTTLTDSARVVAATRDLDATMAVEEARTAHVLEQATTTYEQYGAEAATRVIERQLDHVRSTGLAPANLERMERAANGAVHSFATDPADQAKKAIRTNAYELAR
jgi:Ca-activated chloride channel homolog